MKPKVLFSIIGLVVLVIIIVSAGNISDTPDNIVQYKDIEINCINIPDDQREFGIGTEAGYQDWIKKYSLGGSETYKNPLVSCIDYEFPKIDFNEKSLLGYKIAGSGCSSKTEKQVTKNEPNKELVYKIDAKLFGSCEKLITLNNFILIPRVPDGFRIGFEVNKSEGLTEE